MADSKKADEKEMKSKSKKSKNDNAAEQIEELELQSTK